MKKRILSILLAMCMLMSLLPVAAFAAGGEQEGGDSSGGTSTPPNQTTPLAVAANLHDTLGVVSDDILKTGYSVSAEAGKDENTVNVTVTHTGLRAHANDQGEDKVPGFWVGVGVPKTTGATYNTGFGEAPGTANISSWYDGNTQTTDKKDYTTFYFNATGKEDRDSAYIIQRTGTADNYSYKTYIIDLSGVTRKVELGEKTNFYWFKADRPDGVPGISDWRDMTMLFEFKDTIPANEYVWAKITDPNNKVYGIALGTNKYQACSFLTHKDGDDYTQFEVWPDGVTRGVTIGNYKVEIMESPAEITNTASLQTNMEESSVLAEKVIKVQAPNEIQSLNFSYNGDTTVVNPCDPEAMWIKTTDNYAQGSYWLTVTDAQGRKVIDEALPTAGEGTSYTKAAWSFLVSEQVANAPGVTPGAKYTATLYAVGNGNTDATDVKVELSKKEITVPDIKDATVSATIKSGANGTVEAAWSGDAIALSGTLSNVEGSTVTVTLTFANDIDTYTKDITLNVTGANVSTTGKVKALTQGREYSVTVDMDVLDYKVVESKPAVDTDNTNLASGTTSSDLGTLATAIANSSVTGSVISDNATAIASKSENSVDVDDAVAKLDAAITGQTITEGNTNIVVVPKLDIAVKEYDKTAGVVKLEISASYNVVATTETVNSSTVNTLKYEGSGTNAVVVDTVDVPVSTSIELKVNLGTSFAGADTTLFVKHHEGDEAHYHQGSYVKSTGILTFTSTDGLSPFEVDVSKTAMAASINGKLYETLADAVAAVQNGEEIVLQNNVTLASDVTVSRAVSFTVILNEHTITGTGNIVAGSGYRNDGTGNSYVFVSTSSGGGGGGSSASVSIPSTSNGRVTVSNSNAKAGDTVTITLTPNTGYVVDTVAVTDSKGNAVTVSKTDDTHYTFTMPEGRVTVRATFKQADTPVTPITNFTDVEAGAYYEAAVKWAVDNGITNGLTATTFGPNNSCTRGQMVTFLWRAAGSPAATGTNSFADVASGEYYYNAVLWAVEKGITNGTSATTFSPNATVNRGQTVTFLYRYAESPAATGDTGFTDVVSDAFYADAVKWAVGEEITNGTSATTFAPSSNCTRGQIVTFMYRQMAE